MAEKSSGGGEHGGGEHQIAKTYVDSVIARIDQGDVST